jgi:hypothetical protein
MMMAENRQNEQEERDAKSVPEADGMFPEERTGQYPEEHPQPVEGEGCGEESLDFEPPASQAESSYPGDRAPDVVEGEQPPDTEQEDEMSPVEPASHREEGMYAEEVTMEDPEASAQQKSIETVDDALKYIVSWANRGNLRQFYTEASARISSDKGCEVELDGDVLTIYNVHKEGGILGIGAQTIYEPALRLVQDGETVTVSDEPMDPNCVMMLAESLSER